MNNFCKSENNVLKCYNCAQMIPNLEKQGLVLVQDNKNTKVLLCSAACLEEFDIDNKEKIININKVFRLIEGGLLSPFRETYYCSLRRLKEAKKQLEKQKINIVFESKKKYFEDDFASRYENDLDSTSYDEKRRMICGSCKKLIDLDNEEIRKELYGEKPDVNSRIYADGCTAVMYCDEDCVDKTYTF